MRTRASKNDPCSRFYSPDDFDVVAACLHARTERWDFSFIRSTELNPHKACQGKIANNVRVDEKVAAGLSGCPKNGGNKMKSRKRCPRVISLYTGVGGLDFGFEAASSRRRLRSSSMDACASIRAQSWLAGHRARHHEVSSEEILERAGAPGTGRRPDRRATLPAVLEVGLLGERRADRSALIDRYGTDLAEFLRVIEEAIPHVFLLENVEGIVFFRTKTRGVQISSGEVERINRRAATTAGRCHFSMAADYGVPQLR